MCLPFRAIGSPPLTRFRISLITKNAVFKLRQVQEISAEYLAKSFHVMTIHSNHHNIWLPAENKQGCFGNSVQCFQVYLIG